MEAPVAGGQERPQGRARIFSVPDAVPLVHQVVGWSGQVRTRRLVGPIPAEAAANSKTVEAAVPCGQHCPWLRRKGHLVPIRFGRLGFGDCLVRALVLYVEATASLSSAHPRDSVIHRVWNNYKTQHVTVVTFALLVDAEMELRSHPFALIG